MSREITVDSSLRQPRDATRAVPHMIQSAYAEAYGTAESITRTDIGTWHMFSTQIAEFDVSMTHIRLLPNLT
jgi:hypothetical protein